MKKIFFFLLLIMPFMVAGQSAGVIASSRQTSSPIVATTWNAADKFLVALSGSDLYTTKQAGSNSQVRSVASMGAADMFVWEIHPVVVTDVTALGISQNSNDNAQIPGQESPDVAYWSFGYAFGGTATGLQGAFTAGQTITCLWNGPAGTFEVKIDGVSNAVWTGLTGTYYASWGAQDVSPLPEALANFDATTLDYPQIGYTTLH